MAEQTPVDDFGLVQTFEDYVQAHVGPAYLDGSVDNVVFARSYTNRKGAGEGHAHFSITRERDADTDEVQDIVYGLHQGTTTTVSVFPPAIMEYVELDADDIDEEDDELTTSNCFSYSVSFECGTIEVVNILSYCINGNIMTTRPFIDGVVIEDADVLDDLEPTFTKVNGLTVVEYRRPGGLATATRTELDEFEAITAELTGDAARLESCIERMRGILAIVEHGF